VKFETREDGTLNVFGLPLMRPGKWKGFEFTSDVLDGIVDAFTTLGSKYRLRLKIGHGTQPKDAAEYPSLGDGAKVYRDSGGTLLGDFVKVPKVIGRLIAKGAFREVSPELYSDLNYNGTMYPWVLFAASLLGESPKAIRDLPNLDTIEGVDALYASDAHSEVDLESAGAVAFAFSDPVIVETRSDDKNEKDKNMSEKLVETLEKQIEGFKAEKAELETKITALSGAEKERTEAIAKLEAEKAELSERVEAIEKAESERKVKAFEDKKAELKGSLAEKLEKVEREKLEALIETATEATFETVKAAVESVAKSSVLTEQSNEGATVEGRTYPEKFTDKDGTFEVTARDEASKIEKYAHENKLTVVEATNQMIERGLIELK